MRRLPPFPSENEAQAQADRKTAGLISVAVVLGLLIVGLWLVHALHDTGRIEDCLMAGRINCDRMVR